jgi:hypothetical protein
MDRMARRRVLRARWPIAGVVVATVFVLLLAAWLAQHRHPPSLLALTLPDLAGLEEQLEREREACVAGPPQGPACVEAERLTRAVSARRRERI